MKRNINNNFKVAVALIMILGLNAPVAVQASTIDFTNIAEHNGNTVTDPNTTPPFNSPSFAALGAHVDFVNNQTVTIDYDPTVLPAFPSGLSELVDIRVFNKTGVEWASLTVEFINLQPLDNPFGTGLTFDIQNPHFGGETITGATVQVDYTNSDASAIGGNSHHLKISGAIFGFPDSQELVPFSVLITPIPVLADVPVPAAVWFFATGLLVLFGGGRYNRKH